MIEQVIKTSDEFWKAMENVDEAGMRTLALEDCTLFILGLHVS